MEKKKPHTLHPPLGFVRCLATSSSYVQRFAFQSPELQQLLNLVLCNFNSATCTVCTLRPGASGRTQVNVHQVVGACTESLVTDQQGSKIGCMHDRCRQQLRQLNRQTERQTEREKDRKTDSTYVVLLSFQKVNAHLTSSISISLWLAGSISPIEALQFG